MDDYRTVADAVAADIAAGRLRPGDRLAPQRAFARRHGIANSTAIRVYAELARRGLVVGEVGRGTFVRAAPPADGPALAEPAPQRIDLELNHPVAEGQSQLLAPGLAALQRPDVLGAALRPLTAAGTPAAREAFAELLARGGPRPDPGRLLFAGNGRQAIAAALAALVPPGGRLAVDALTYPVVKALAARLGISLVPVPSDEHGMLPAALAELHRAAPLHALYTQPTLHNPLGVTMPDDRRAELAVALGRLGLHAVEDAVWGFLAADAPPPLAAYAPDRVVLVDSLSKRLAPGLTVGVAVTPRELSAPVSAALRSAGTAASGFALAVACRWIADGTVDAVVAAKRRDAAARARIAAERLAGFSVTADPRACFCWWRLPGPWRADTFVAAAARQGIAVTPAAAFAAGRGGAPHAVRIGLASPSPQVLGDALDVLARIARGGPEDNCAD
ncbi:PLP-dependent aminotransferase family protein [Actinacidiphila glaucinigra]|uniref:aminotransferase-like domain-containing protein n=1 Tax=Actinacidiphila glaucinigra TaxID=235986 RepID=UPI002DD9AD48|nr:PLP-dependent aminotransferase family protein [Actinacidiphila glaucinigra]WSD58705.1 PLP-dependent aminotransferase family protein [Actinacidiphila glaucinigra]